MRHLSLKCLKGVLHCSHFVFPNLIFHFYLFKSVKFINIIIKFYLNLIFCQSCCTLCPGEKSHDEDNQAYSNCQFCWRMSSTPKYQFCNSKRWANPPKLWKNQRHQQKRPSTSDSTGFRYRYTMTKLAMHLKTHQKTHQKKP